MQLNVLYGQGIAVDSLSAVDMQVRHRGKKPSRSNSPLLLAGVITLDSHLTNVATCRVSTRAPEPPETNFGSGGGTFEPSPASLPGKSHPRAPTTRPSSAKEVQILCRQRSALNPACRAVRVPVQPQT